MTDIHILLSKVALTTLSDRVTIAFVITRYVLVTLLSTRAFLTDQDIRLRYKYKPYVGSETGYGEQGSRKMDPTAAEAGWITCLDYDCDLCSH